MRHRGFGPASTIFFLFRPRTIFGIGAIAAELTSPHVSNEGVVGILNYESEFFVTNEREIGFRKWMGAERPDATLYAAGSRLLRKLGQPTNDFSR